MRLMRARRLHNFLVVAYELTMQLVFCLPRFAIFNMLKTSFLKMMGSKVGRRVTYYPGVWIAPGRNLVIGDDVDLALQVMITTAGGVKIGDRTLIGYRTQILSSNHNIPFDNGRIIEAGHRTAPVSIGPDVWIGGSCIILPGVSIGEGAVIGAGSVVTKSVEPFSIVAGNPARLIRMRHSKAE